MLKFVYRNQSIAKIKVVHFLGGHSIYAAMADQMHLSITYNQTLVAVEM